MSTVVLAELDDEACHVHARGGTEFGCPAVAQFAVELRSLRGAAAEEPPKVVALDRTSLQCVRVRAPTSGPRRRSCLRWR
jgi:hypothetical protein